jgi:ethanolamine permease
VFGEGTAAELLALIGLTGLIASFFTIIYAYGRNTYSLSRAGYFPKWLSVTHGTRNTPHVALIAGAVVGYALAVLIYELGQSEGALAGKIVGALLYMAVFGAVISYFMQCLSFILLRRNLPDIERPYRSPVGLWGAGHRRGHRPGLADLAVPQRGLPPGRVRDPDLLPARHRPTSPSPAGTAWCCRPRRSSR